VLELGLGLPAWNKIGAHQAVQPFTFRATGAEPHFRRNIWRPAVADANLAGLRIHDLRHTAVALWIAAGASPKEVAARAGHTSVSFVLDRYGHLPRGRYGASARLDTLFGAATEHRRNTVA
jgi:integrase